MGCRRTVSVGSFASLASLAALCVPLLFATAASAHEVGGSRFDAPLPLSLLFAGAGATVGVTALLLGVVAEPATGARDTPNPVGTGDAFARGEGGARAASTAMGTETGTGARTPDVGRVLAAVSPSIARGVRFGARVVFLTLFVGAVVVGLFGTQTGAESLATTFVWPVWVKGVGLYAILFGDPWRVLSPWRTLYDALCRLEGGDEIALFEGYPAWLGRWPALVGFVVLVGVLENLTVVPQLPHVTAALVAGYAALMLAGAVLFGSVWFERADAFSVLYALFGRVAPVRPARTDDGGYRITLRAPWQGCTRSVADLVVVAFAVAAVYTVSFDGFTSTPEFQRLLFDARDALGIGGVVSVVLYLAGLIGFVCLFCAVSWVMGAIADSDGRWRVLARSFAPTVLPIAAAYEVAHNYPFVVDSLGLFVVQARSLLLGTSADPVALLDWLSVGAFWYSQVLLIVIGHVIAVIAAHRVALAYGETIGEARRMHVPLVLLMIGYTVLSLWIVSRPVVAG